MHSGPGAKCHERVVEPNGSNENTAPEPGTCEVSQMERRRTTETREENRRARMKNEVEGGD